MSVMLYVVICVLCVIVGSYAPSLGPTHHHCVLPIFVGSLHHRWPLCFVIGPYTSMLDSTLDLTCHHRVLQSLLVSYHGWWAPSSSYPTCCSWFRVVPVYFLLAVIGQSCSTGCVVVVSLLFPLLLVAMSSPVLLVIFTQCHSAHVDGRDEPYYAHHNMANFLVGSPCRYECCVGFEHR